MRDVRGFGFVEVLFGFGEEEDETKEDAYCGED
jgi:hypothetical protein